MTDQTHRPRRTLLSVLATTSMVAAALTMPITAARADDPTTPVPPVPPVPAQADGGIVDAANRQQVIDTYKDVYLLAYTTEFAWNGNVSTCQPGSPSATILNASLSATNYVRDLAGVPPVFLDSTKSAYAQQAALMMDASNTLTHSPAPSMKCYTDVGAAAAGRSNLALGYSGVQSIGGYMSDTGSNNTYAGHRKWILDPGLTSVGFGITPRANAMYVVGDDYRWDAGLGGTSWPTAGYFPEGLYPGASEWSMPGWIRGTGPERWSYTTYDTTEFDTASVTVTQIAPTVKALPVNIEAQDTGHIVFAPVGVTLPSEVKGQDVTYQVTISGLTNIDGLPVAPVTYTTTLVPSPNQNPYADDDDDTNTPTTGTITIKGTAKAGKRLRATVTGYSPTPTRVTYQWLRNNRPVRNATRPTYKVKRADKGSKMRVRVTVIRTRLPKSVVTSKPVKVRRR